MPSPTFGARGVVPDAVAMAIREAWSVAERGPRAQVLNVALRRILGDNLADRALAPALILLQLQPAPPAGDVEPPAIALLDLCPRCRRVQLREARRPFRGKVRMEALRDPIWMQRQFEQLGRSDAQVAEDLGCCKQSVMEWRQRHGIEPGKAHQPWMQEPVLRRLLIDRRLAPGEAAAELGCRVWTVRGWARKLGIVGTERDFAHCTEAWWRERVLAGWTQYRMAEAAGIVTHAVLYHLRKWGLHQERPAAERSRLRKPVHTQLYEPGWLARQLAAGSRPGYAAIGRRLKCSASAVHAAAVKLGLVPGRTPPRPTPWKRDPAWYRERFAKRWTAAQMATEVGDVTEKSILNYMGELGLLEEYHVKVERWDETHLRRAREGTLRRQAAMLRRQAIA